MFTDARLEISLIKFDPAQSRTLTKWTEALQIEEADGFLHKRSLLYHSSGKTLYRIPFGFCLIIYILRDLL